MRQAAGRRVPSAFANAKGRGARLAVFCFQNVAGLAEQKSVCR